MVKELIFGNDRIWIQGCELLDERETKMITSLNKTIAKYLRTLDCPPIVLDFKEQNLDTHKTTLYFKIATTNSNGVCVLGEKMSKTLFETTAIQTYRAENRKFPDENYDGVISMRLVLEEPDRKREEGIEGEKREPCNMATIITRIVYGNYYDEIAKFYPEWTTYYRDAPVMTAVPTDRI